MSRVPTPGHGQRVQLHTVSLRGGQQARDLPILQWVLVRAPGGDDDRAGRGRTPERGRDGVFVVYTDRGDV